MRPASEGSFGDASRYQFGASRPHEDMTRFRPDGG